MPFNIRTLGQWVESARQAFRTYLPGTDAWLWPNNIGPTAKVIGGMTHEVMGYAGYISRQKFAHLADGDSLDEHGADLGMGRRARAGSRGFVVFSASTALTVLAGAILQRSDGAQYSVLVGGSLPGAGTLTLEVVSLDEGLSTIAVGAIPLTAVSGVTGTATVAADANGITGGADVESDESYRARILFRKRNPPMGGSASDWVTWALSYPGVTRVFVERVWNGPGTVRIFPLFDDDYANGIPPGSVVTALGAYLEQFRPAGAAVQLQAPTPLAIPVTITGLTPDTTAVREAVLAELRSAFRRLGRVAGSDTTNAAMPYLATPLSFSRSWIWQAVANATGEEAHQITAPASDTVVAAGYIPVLGTVTFV